MSLQPEAAPDCPSQGAVALSDAAALPCPRVGGAVRQDASASPAPMRCPARLVLRSGGGCSAVPPGLVSAAASPRAGALPQPELELAPRLPVPRVRVSCEPVAPRPQLAVVRAPVRLTPGPRRPQAVAGARLALLPPAVARLRVAVAPQPAESQQPVRARRVPRALPSSRAAAAQGSASPASAAPAFSLPVQVFSPRALRPVLRRTCRRRAT